MEKNESKKLVDSISVVAGKFAGSRFVRAILDAGYSVISFTIIGALFLVLTILPQAFPIPAFASWYAATIGRFNSIFQIVYNATMGIIGIVFAGTFAFSYTKIYRDEEHLNLVPLNGLMLFLMAFFIAIPQVAWKNGILQLVQLISPTQTIVSGYEVSGSGVVRIGAVGIFVGMVVAWLTVQIYRYTVKHNWQIKMPSSVPAGVANSFSALIPGTCIAAVVALIDLCLVYLKTDLFKILSVPFSFISYIADTWWGFLIIIVLIQILWWFGIHNSVIGAFYTPIALANMAANVNGAHHVFSGGIMDTFVKPGGAGATLGLTIWLLFRARSNQLKELGKVEIVPAIFQINEPIIFGLPIVYNITLLLPFILAPVATGIVTYIAIATRLVPPIILKQPWPTPIGLNGFLATASWQGAVLSIVCALVSFLVWYPFIKAYDNMLYKKEQAKKVEEAA